MKLIAITGGIGSGKSVVARMLQVMGYGVYDCDSRAKALMIERADVKMQLVEAFGNDTYMPDGALNRQHLSATAFGDDKALARLNSIVHPATVRDIQRWAAVQAEHGDRIAFVETALLHTAALENQFDEVWHVVAPDEIRIQRVMSRSGLTAPQVRARMAAQVDEDRVEDGERVILNDNEAALLPQVIQRITSLNNTII